MALARLDTTRPWGLQARGGRGFNLGPGYGHLGYRGRCNHWKYRDGVRLPNGYAEKCVLGRCPHDRWYCDCGRCMEMLERSGQVMPNAGSRSHRLLMRGRPLVDRRYSEDHYLGPQFNGGAFVPHTHEDPYDDNLGGPYGMDDLDDLGIWDDDEDEDWERYSGISYHRHRPWGGPFQEERLPHGNHNRGLAAPYDLPGRSPYHHLRNLPRPNRRHSLGMNPMLRGHGHRRSQMHPGMGLMGGRVPLHRRPFYGGNLTPVSDGSGDSW